VHVAGVGQAEFEETQRTLTAGGCKLLLHPHVVGVDEVQEPARSTHTEATRTGYTKHRGETLKRSALRSQPQYEQKGTMTTLGHPTQTGRAHGPCGLQCLQVRVVQADVHADFDVLPQLAAHEREEEAAHAGRVVLDLGVEREHDARNGGRDRIQQGGGGGREESTTVSRAERRHPSARSPFKTVS
jgi:hypothetical protein